MIFDNRDVGQSSLADGRYRLSDMASDALALADALGIDSFHLLGVSMGGAISQELALAAPERVRPSRWPSPGPARGRWARSCRGRGGRRAQLIEREEMIDELMLLTLSEAFFENEEAVHLAARHDAPNPHPQPPEAFARQLEASTRHDARDRLGSLDDARPRDRRRVRHPRAGLEVARAGRADPGRAS